MAVGAQELRQALLELQGQGAATVVPGQPLRRGLAHGSSDGRVGAHLLGERPER